MTEVKLQRFIRYRHGMSAHIIFHNGSKYECEYSSMKAKSLKKFSLPFMKKTIQVYTEGANSKAKNWNEAKKEHTLIEKGKFRTLKEAMEAGRDMLEKQLEMKQEIDKIEEM